MIGIFDSGMGGAFALAELRRIRPDADAVFFADRKNAPYGTKSQDVLRALAERDIEILRSCGADDILIACCTASTVYPLLSLEHRRGVIPIIDATAYAAIRMSKSKRIGVLATELTVSTGAFEGAIRNYCKSAEVSSVSLQGLVFAIENGESTDKLVEDALRSFGDVDTVVLGCTHFAAIEEKVKKEGFATVNSARIGAELLSERVKSGCGVTLYINE